MKIKLINYIICYTSLSFAMNGQWHNINENLTQASIEALANLEKLFQQPGPARVHIRKMLEGIQGKNRNARVINPSIISYNDEGYLLSVRVLFHNDSYFQHIIPGNRADSKFEKGDNFWWQDFSSTNFSSGTLYFYADANLENFSLLAPLNYSSYPEQIFGQDIRLVNVNNDASTFDPKSEFIATNIVKIMLIPDTNLGVLIFAQRIANKSRGNNYSAIDINIDEGKYSYIDWFFPEGVRLAQIENNKIIYHFLSYDDPQYPILGVGSSIEDNHNAQENSGIMPMFSLGSNHIKIDQHTYMGVGHTKIYVDEDKFTYKNNSFIDCFRKKLTKDFKEAFGDRYIRHDAYNSERQISQGYHYLMYFYYFKLDDNGKAIEMKLSDSFLPIDLKMANDSSNFVFSLVFPMGISEKQGDSNTILISAGIGDYYAAIITLPKDFIFQSCKHDVVNLNMNNYEYKIMRFHDNGQFDIVDHL